MIATIVTAGFSSDFFGIIVVMVVIGRIIGAIKKASSGGGATEPSPGAQRKLETDLERFFQNIAGQSESLAVEHVPPPPPVPAVSVARRKVASEKRTAAPVPKARPVSSKPAAWGTESYGMDAAVPNRATCTETGQSSRAEIVAMLKEKNSIRNAVILREVLGPPVAMRG